MTMTNEAEVARLLTKANEMHIAMCADQWKSADELAALGPPEKHRAEFEAAAVEAEKKKLYSLNYLILLRQAGLDWPPEARTEATKEQWERRMSDVLEVWADWHIARLEAEKEQLAKPVSWRRRL